jgi:hypothetical protein
MIKKIDLKYDRKKCKNGVHNIDLKKLYLEISEKESKRNL